MRLREIVLNQELGAQWRFNLIPSRSRACFGPASARRRFENRKSD